MRGVGNVSSERLCLDLSLWQKQGCAGKKLISKYISRQGILRDGKVRIIETNSHD